MKKEDFSGTESENKLVFEMLIYSEENYRSLVEQATDGIFIADQDGHFITVNPAGCAMAQYSEDELLKMSIYDMALTEDLAKNPFHLDDLKKGLPVRTERPMRRKDGLTIDVEINAKIITDGRMLVFVRDITDLKKAEEELRMSSQRMSNHLNNSPLAVIEWDKNLIIRRWSVQAETIFDWKEAEVINKHFNDFNLVFEEDAEAVALIANELMTGAIDRNKSENRNYTKSGKVIYCQWFNSVLKDEQGNIQSILSLVQDVTENKKADLLLTGEKEVMEMIATEQPLNLILSTITLNFEKINNDALCSILLLDEEGTHIKLGAGPSLPDAYNKGIDGEPIGPVAGSCGTAAYRKERVIVADIANDPLWVNYRDFALSFGLKAAWSTPIMDNHGKVYGTFAVYYKECRSPDDSEIRLLERYTSTALIALERYFKEIQLKESVDRFRSLYENSGEAILLTKTDGSILSANPAACNMFGRSEEEICMIGRNGIVNLEDPRLVPALEERKRTGKMKGELTFKRKDGTIFPGEISSTVFTTVSGEERTSMLIRDISEQKKAEEKIKESEEKFISIFKAAPGSMILSSLPDGKTIEVNNNFSLITGYTKEEALGKTTAEVGMWADPEARIKFLSIFQTDGFVKDFEADLKHKSGAILTGLVSGKIVSVQDKKYIVSSFIDVTERKKAEEKLMKSEELFSSAFHTSPAGISITRIADGKIIDVNEAFLRMFEFSREEVIGHTSIELNLLTPEQRKKIIQQQIATGGLTNAELLSKTKSGKPIHLLFSSKPLEINNEACHITTLIDITDRKIAELKIIKSEKLYRNLFENILDGFAYCKAIFNTQGRVIDFEYITINNEYERIFQLHNATGKRVTEVLPGSLESDPAYLDIINRVVLEKKTVKFETYLKTLNIWLSSSFYHSEDEYFVTVIEDITKRKTAEEKILKTTEQLQQLNSHLQSIREEERKRIGREIHDELGQQLTAMQMDVIWVDKKIPDESAAIKSKLKSILSLLDGSNESVRKILNELRPTILDEHSLPEVLEWQGIQFTESTGIPLEFRNNEPLPKLKEDIINCIFRTYQETLTNITKYAGAGKVVTTLHIQNGNLILAVEDNGKGFNIAKARDKKSFGLMGIKERVRSVNGSFELISSPGNGTKIIISIPVHPEQAS